MTTDEQINRDIAEWCGWEEVNADDEGRAYWLVSPEGSTEKPNFLDEIQGLGLLFKYAMPHIDADVTIERHRWTDYYWAIIGYMGTPEDKSKAIKIKGKSPTRALALAIHRLIKEDDNVR